MNLHQILYMGGYGFYVWPAYGVTVFVFSLNLWMALREKRQVTQKLMHYFDPHYE